jgi:hypothetical protein
MTYDNSGNSEPHTYTYASEFGQARPSQWSHAPGLDSYAGPNVTAGVPQLATSGNNSTPQGCALPPGPLLTCRAMSSAILQRRAVILVTQSEARCFPAVSGA